MNILEELWYGRVCPTEQEGYKQEEYRELVLLFESNEIALQNTLTEEQKSIYEKLKDVAEEMKMLSDCGAFLTGYRLAAQITAAALVPSADGRMF